MHPIFESDGYRDNSESDKQAATAKFKFNISEDTKPTTLINWFDQEAQDPLAPIEPELFRVLPETKWYRQLYSPTLV